MTQHYATLTPKALTSKLKAQGLPGDAIFKAVEQAKTVRQALRSDRAFLRKHRQAWRSLLTPLRQEMNHAWGGMRYDEADALRADAFQLYAQTLEVMYYRLLQLTGPVVDGEMAMPSRVAAQINEEIAQGGNGSPVPNGGVHWVDWVPPKARARVERAFDAWMMAGTRKKHAKTKVPFKRVEGDKVFAKNKERLLRAVTNELGTLTLKHEVALQGVAKRMAELAEYGAQRLGDESDLHLRLERRMVKARKALSILTRWTKDDGALPRTWHGVLKK
jgi:hypothetical protein